MVNKKVELVDYYWSNANGKDTGIERNKTAINKFNSSNGINNKNYWRKWKICWFSSIYTNTIYNKFIYRPTGA